MIQSGVRTDVPDSTIKRIYPAGNLSDLLGKGGSLNLKTYGPGGLATTSVRGANSMQTPIVWNGINLQNITNNTVDLSLMPVFLFDDVAIQPGSSSAAWGSGTIGGAIRVGSRSGQLSPSGHFLSAPFIKQKAVMEFGSFGAVMGGYQVAGGVNQWRYSIKMYRQLAQNNFSFNNTALTGSPEKFLSHAVFVQHGFMTELFHHDSAYKHIFGLRMWVQETRREIPPTMLQSVSEATQQDYALRIVGDWTWYPGSQLAIVSRVCLIHEGLLYNPGNAGSISNTDMWTAIAGSDFRYSFEGKTSRLFRRMTLSGGISAIRSMAVVTEYVPSTTQFRASAFVSLGQYVRSDDEWNISVREELVDDNWIDPVGSAWYYLNVKKWLAFRFCVAHNYRVPTFNDLYWVPGGNPGLRAETSWTEEVTLEFKPSWGSGSLQYSYTYYNRNVRDMITWVPDAAYWSPQNINEVWSRGAEHRMKVNQSWMKWKFTLLLNADYVRSTYEKSEIPNDVSVGTQLIYVPAWFGGGSLTAQWKDYFITYSHQYTDLRFTSRDHTEWLPAHNIASAAFGWNAISKIHSWEYGINIFIRVNNIFDVQYQAIAWRPMPGRNYSIGCTIEFSKLFNRESNTN